MTTETRPPTRIGVVKPCCIGDCVMALPTLDSISAAFEAAELQLFVGQHSRAVLEGHSSRWTIRTIDDQISAPQATRLALMARTERLDLVVLLERSRLLRTAFGALARTRVASVAIVQPEIRHESIAYLDVLRGLGIEPSVTNPNLTPAPVATEAARRLLARWPHPVILHPGGAENPGSTMPDKRWPTSRFAALARAIEADGTDVVFTGGSGDRTLVEQVMADAGLPFDRCFAGQIDLSTAVAMAAQARLFVGGDTGMCHVAAAVGAPVVAIFGPTNPRRYRPIGDHVTVVAPDASWCQPDADLRRSDIGPRPSTDEVTLVEVLAACRSALKTSVSAR